MKNEERNIDGNGNSKEDSQHVVAMKIQAQPALITHLDLSGIGLYELGSEVEQLSALKSIDLSNNSLTVLPPVLTSLKYLETLNLNSNCIKNLHLSTGGSSCAETKLNDGINEELDLTTLPALEELDLSGNLLTEFPHSLTQTVSITRLNISNNELQQLPNEFKSFPVIRKLILNENPFIEMYSLPTWIFNIKRCSNLSFGFCYMEALLSEFPLDFGHNCRLISYLDLRSTGIKEFPLGLTGMLDLRTLLLSNPVSSESAVARRSDMRHNSIWKLCPEMTRLVGLVSLDLSNIGLNETPEGFGKLRHLRFLDLSRNFLFWIKEELYELGSLQYLNLSNNQLVILEPGLSKLIKLQELNISHNKIYDIPEDILQLTQLQILDAYRNQIAELPDLFPPEKLTSTDLACNDISLKMIEKEYPGLANRYLDMQTNLRNFPYAKAEDREDIMEEIAAKEEDEAEIYDENSSEESDDENRVVLLQDLNSSTESESWIDFEPIGPARDRAIQGCSAFPEINHPSHFCPADDHVLSLVKTKTIIRLERERNSVIHNSNGIKSSQFADAEEEDESLPNVD